jgi:hypothetical protein
MVHFLDNSRTKLPATTGQGRWMSPNPAMPNYIRRKRYPSVKDAS